MLPKMPTGQRCSKPFSFFFAFILDFTNFRKVNAKKDVLVKINPLHKGQSQTIVDAQVIHSLFVDLMELLTPMNVCFSVIWAKML